MPELSIEYRKLEEIVMWEDNTKLHDLQAIALSIQRYGFRDAVIYDSTLQRLVAGHGRLLALSFLKAQGEPAPIGIQAKDGTWLVPVQVGINAASETEAKAFAIDHNNLVAADMGFQDLARMHDTRYARVLLKLTQETPTVTVNQEQAEELKRYMTPDIAKADIDQAEDVVRIQFPVTIRVLVEKTHYDKAYQVIKKALNPAQATLK